MSRIFSFIIILIFAYSFQSNAQIAEGIPVSFNYLQAYPEIKEIKFPQPDVAEYLEQDAQSDKEGGYYRIGRSINADIDMFGNGQWETYADGQKICRLKLTAPGARALGIYYDSFWLPEGGRLFIYTQDKNRVIGAFTSDNNPERGYFATELTGGETVILEYDEPAGTTQKPIIHISELAYIYRGYNSEPNNTWSFGDAASCEVNVNCSEGTDWQDQKRGVARILLKEGTQYGWCTGSLVNNVRLDFEPYFLTADHCGQNSSVSDYDQWIFYFNFETGGCTNPASSPNYNTITGCTKVANGGNAGTSGSDFKLLLFNNNVPLAYNVYFNGWDLLNQASTSGVCIHHPSGDIKKVSTYNSTLTTSGWNGSGYNSHWRVFWTSTTNGYGVTEGGSSGSPLFNQDGSIVGTLTGGSSYCSTPYLPDYYGKFSYSWESNGTTASSHLKEWLDPDTTGVSLLSGLNQQVAIFGLAQDYCFSDSAVSITGVPSNGIFSGPGISGNTFYPSQATVGNHFIIFTSGMGTATFQLTVHADPTLDLGPDLTLAAGQTANVQAPFGYTTYNWSDGSTGQSISVTQAGLYSLTLMDGNGCQAVDEILIDFSGLPMPPWSFMNTGNNHLILVQDTTPVTINGISVEIGDYLGVFYDSLGVLACAGYMPWTGTTFSMTAWGAQTGLVDGFAIGEELKWKIWDASDSAEIEAQATYINNTFPNQGYYAPNGLSGLASLTSNTLETQVIELAQGWGMMSTYIYPLAPLIDSVFAPLNGDIVILKNGNGDVYWPPFGNFIGNLQTTQGYQIYMNSAQDLSITGIYAVPENTPFQVPLGWSMVGYLRKSPGDATFMLASIGASIVIVKDGNGEVYWPIFSLNNIGNMLPGQGYQIKLSAQEVLEYPAN